MLLGKVTGSLWSTRKDEKLNGWKFMMVDILNQEEQKQGFIIAADNAGAGIGDKVLISQGNAARISDRWRHRCCRGRIRRLNL